MIVKINIDRPMTQNPKPQFGFSEPWSCVFNGVQQWFQVQLLIGTVVIFSQQQSCSYFLPEAQMCNACRCPGPLFLLSVDGVLH
jgi:hypothetical protein